MVAKPLAHPDILPAKAPEKPRRADPEIWQVLTRDPFGNHTVRVHSGTETAARQFVEQHYPRVHVNAGQPPVPDAVLEHEGHTEQFWGPETGWKRGK